MNRLLTLALLLMLALPSWGAITLVNTTSGSDSTGTGHTSQAAAAASHTAGNLLAVWVRFGSQTTTVTSVTDTAGNTYSSGTLVLGGTGGGQWWYAWNITGNASNIVTVNFSQSDTFTGVIVLQYAGVATASDPSDIKAGAGTSTTGAGSLTSPTFTTAQANEVILVGANVGNLGLTYTAGNIGGVASTLRGGQPAGMMAAEDLVVSSIQTTQTGAMFWNSSSAALLQVIGFKAAGGGGGATPAGSKAKKLQKLDMAIVN